MERDIEDRPRDELSHLAGTVAHELSFPLAAIVASAQSVIAFSATEQQGGGAICRCHEELDLIVSEARRAAQIADRLMSVVQQQYPEGVRVRRRNTEPRLRPVLVTAVDDTECNSKHTVLLVDDEQAIRRSVSRFLRLSGYDVVVASSGLEAANALRARRFDAVVSDLRMPELSGEQLFDLLKNEFPGMTLRVVFTSGDLRRHETGSFIKQSGCPALDKPYDLPDLLEIVSRLCNNGHGKDES